MTKEKDGPGTHHCTRAGTAAPCPSPQCHARGPAPAPPHSAPRPARVTGRRSAPTILRAAHIPCATPGGPRGLGGGNHPGKQNRWVKITPTWGRTLLGGSSEARPIPSPASARRLSSCPHPHPGLGHFAGSGTLGCGCGQRSWRSQGGGRRGPPRPRPGTAGGRLRWPPPRRAASPGELPDTQSTCLRSCWQLNWNRKFAL